MAILSDVSEVRLLFMLSTKISFGSNPRVSYNASSSGKGGRE